MADDGDETDDWFDDDDDDEDDEDDFFSLASCCAFFERFHFMRRFWNQILTCIIEKLHKQTKIEIILIDQRLEMESVKRYKLIDFSIYSDYLPHHIVQYINIRIIS